MSLKLDHARSSTMPGRARGMAVSQLVSKYAFTMHNPKVRWTRTENHKLRHNRCKTRIYCQCLATCEKVSI